MPMAGPEFYPYKLSDLKPTPLPSLHVDLFYDMMLISIYFIFCPLLISLYNIAFSYNYMSLLNQRCCQIMPTLVEIGPSNASQGQHRRKDATE